MTKKLNAQMNSIYRIIFALPFTALTASMNWQLSNEAMWCSIIFGIISAIDIVVYYKSIEILDATTFVLLDRSNLIVSLFMGVVLGFEIIGTEAIIGTIIFIVSVLLISDLSKTDLNKVDRRKYIYAIILRIISISIITYRSFVIKGMITNGLGTNETIIFLATFLQLILLYIVYKPKLNFKEANCGLYTFQGMCSGINTVAAGYAYVTVGVIVFDSIRTSSVVLIAIIYAIIERKIPSLRKVSGIVLGIASLLIIISLK